MVGASRYTGPVARVAEGWTLERLSPPSRLQGANGIRTGADGRIYIAQVAGSCVSAIDVDTGVIETISAAGGAITGPDDLVFDEAGNLYCTEITRDRVTVLRPDGTSSVVADGINVANPITYHQGRLIAGELTMGGRIFEIDRNSGAKRVICEGVPMANAFEVGPDGKLYFPAQAANEIWRVSLDGGAPEVVAKDLGIPDSVKFHPDGYIVSTQVASGQVLKIDLRTGEKSILADIGPGLDNVAFVNGRTFVSHITGSIHEITSLGTAKPVVDKGLEWPMGVAVNAAGTVYAADGMFAYTVAAGAGIELAGTLFWPGYPGFMRGIAAVGSDWFVTTANGTVARWQPGQEAETLAHGYEIPMGIAVSGQAVVFTDAGTGRVLSLEGGQVTELASGLNKPYGVAISDRGDIFVAEADGQRIVKVTGGKAQTAFDGLGRPEGLAVRGTKLYVVDTATQQVLELDLVTGARTVLASDLPVGGAPGAAPLRLGGVGDMCGPMWSFTGIAAGADGALYLSGDAEGSVLTLRPA
ncbi:MAG: gluconolaconase [Novosphingobium sp.]